MKCFERVGLSSRGLNLILEITDKKMIAHGRHANHRIAILLLEPVVKP